MALLAAAAHADAAGLSSAANVLLVHSPAFLALGLSGPGTGPVKTGGWMLLAGVVLFCGDLAARHFLGSRLFPMAAPAGGLLMIAGWLVIAAGGLVRRSPGT